MTTAAAVAWVVTGVRRDPPGVDVDRIGRNASGSTARGRRWVKYGKEGGVVGPDVEETPADAHLSPALVYMHGAAAAVTVLLVIAAAVKIA